MVVHVLSLQSLHSNIVFIPVTTCTACCNLSLLKVHLDYVSESWP